MGFRYGALTSITPIRLPKLRATVRGGITGFYDDAASPETGGPNFAGAGIDPSVIDVRVTSSVPSTMHRAGRYAIERQRQGILVGAVAYAWYVNGHLRTIGRTAHLRFTGKGWRMIKVVARDSHGHHASHAVTRYIHP